MSFLQDLLPIFRKSFLVFVEKRQEVGNLVTFEFKSENKLDWRPGQHGIFKIVNKKINKPSRTFSIASTPEEDKIMISMRIPDVASEFKRALLELKPGDRISMKGPFGPFYIAEDRPTLMLAAGIGITPFRALVKGSIVNDKIEAKKLLYLDSNKEYIYNTEFDNLSETGPLEVKYLSSREEFNEEIESYIKEMGNGSYYYIAGPKNMVSSIKTKLKEAGINKKNIKTDYFFGY